MPLGLLVAPAYTPEGLEALVEWARAQPEVPVQALKLLRFRSSDGFGYIVLIDEVFLGPGRTVAELDRRWKGR